MQITNLLKWHITFPDESYKQPKLTEMKPVNQFPCM